MPQKRKYSKAVSPDVFVGRQSYMRLLEEAVFDLPANGMSLKVFHGVGGQGKTALRKNFERVLNSDQTFRFIKTSVVDIHKETLADPVSVMVWIRNGFARSGLSLPTFDVAFSVYWQEKYGDRPLPGLINPWLARSGENVTSIATDSASFLMELTEQAVSTLPGLGLLITKTSRWVFDKRRESLLSLKFPELRRLYEDGRLRSTLEIAEDLSYYLAVDLNKYRTEDDNTRYVLIFDEYEKLFPNGGSGERWKRNDYDSYVRQFISEVDGLLAVFFSREPLPWANHPDWIDDLKDNQHSMSSLTRLEAVEWLEASGIDNESLQSSIIDSALIDQSPAEVETSDEVGHVYPLLLSLLIEHYKAFIQDGIEPGEHDFEFSDNRFESRRLAIINRVLHHFDANFEYLLERLCLVKGIDRETFAFIVSKFGVAISLDYFDRLKSISVFSEDEHGVVYLHSAVADAIAQSLSKQKRQETLEALFGHFEKRRLQADAEDNIDKWAYAFSRSAHYLMYQDSDLIRTWFDDLDDNSMLEEDLNPLMFDAIKNCVDHIERWPSRDERVALSLKVVLANAYAWSTRFDENVKAVNLIEEVLSAYRSLGEEGGGEALMASCLLGNCLVATGDTDRGKEILENVWTHFEDLCQEGIAGLECLTDCALGLAGIYNHLDQTSCAVAVYDQLLSKDWSHLHLKHWITNVSWGAFYQSKCGRSELLDDLELKISELFEQSPSSWQGRRANVYTILALSHSNLRNHKKALETIETAERIIVEHYGRLHENTTVVLNQKATCLYAAGRVDDGNRVTKEVYEVQRDVLGRGHPDTAGSLTVLANIYVNDGDFDSAAEAISEALKIYESNSEPLEWQRRDCEYWAAYIYIQLNHPDASIYVSRARTSLSDQSSQAVPRDVQQLLLAALSERTKRGSEQQFYEDVKSAVNKFMELSEPHKNSVQRELAETIAGELVRNGLHDESKKLLRTSCIHDLRTNNLLKPERFSYYFNMAEQEEWHGNFDRAIVYAESALALCRYNLSLVKSTGPVLELRKLLCVYKKEPSQVKMSEVLSSTRRLISSGDSSESQLRSIVEDVAFLLENGGYYKEALEFQRIVNASWEKEGLYPVYAAQLSISLANRLFDCGEIREAEHLYSTFFNEFISQAFQPSANRYLLRWLRYWRVLAAAGNPKKAIVLNDLDLSLRGLQLSHIEENCTIALILTERAINLNRWEQARELLNEVNDYLNSGNIHTAHVSWHWARYLDSEITLQNKCLPKPLCEVVEIAGQLDSP